MLRFALCCTLALACAGVGCSDIHTAPAPTGKPFEITIRCDQDGLCAADQPLLNFWPSQLIVKAREQWDCTVNDQPCTLTPPASQAAIIVLKPHRDPGQAPDSDPGPTRMVTVAFVPEGGAAPSRRLSYGALVASGVAFLVAGLMFFTAFRSANARDRQMGDFAAANAQIGGLSQEFGAIAKALHFPPPPEPPQIRGYPTQPGAPSFHPDEGEKLRAEIGRFVACVREWSVGLGRSVSAVEKNLQELDNLAVRAGRQIDTESARPRFQDAAKAVTKLALSAMDDDLKMSRQKNMAAEAAFARMAEIAGLRLLVPVLGEPFSKARHVSFRNIHDSSQRGLVAEVERRGLLHLDGTVFEPATVVLYA
jgi:hypothetical protein